MTRSVRTLTLVFSILALAAVSLAGECPNYGCDASFSRLASGGFVINGLTRIPTAAYRAAPPAQLARIYRDGDVMQEVPLNWVQVEYTTDCPSEWYADFSDITVFNVYDDDVFNVVIGDASICTNTITSPLNGSTTASWITDSSGRARKQIPLVRGRSTWDDEDPSRERLQGGNPNASHTGGPTALSISTPSDWDDEDPSRAPMQAANPDGRHNGPATPVRLRSSSDWDDEDPSRAPMQGANTGAARTGDPVPSDMRRAGYPPSPRDQATPANPDADRNGPTQPTSRVGEETDRDHPHADTPDPRAAHTGTPRPTFKSKLPGSASLIR